jgi:hypothetical protein
VRAARLASGGQRANRIMAPLSRQWICVLIPLDVTHHSGVISPTIPG